MSRGCVCQEPSSIAYFTAAATKFQGHVTSVIIPRPPGEGGEDRQLQQRAALGLVKRTGPAVAILNAGKKYALGDSVEVTEEAVSRFIQSYRDGSLHPSVASQPDVQAGSHNALLNMTLPGIQVLSAHGLRKAISSLGNMLVWFCVPWLARCKAGAEPFTKAVAALKEDSVLQHMAVATFDGSVNDVPDRFNASGVRIWGNPTIPQEFSSLPITGYHFWRHYHVPALFYLPPGPSKMPIRYEGDLVYSKLKVFIDQWETAGSSIPAEKQNGQRGIVNITGVKEL